MATTASSCEAGPAVPDAVHVVDKKEFQKRCRDLKNAVQKGYMNECRWDEETLFSLRFFIRKVKINFGYEYISEKICNFFRKR